MMFRCNFAVGLSVALFLSAACRTMPEPMSDPKLIGGQDADPGQFPSTVYFTLCTATKIDDHAFLTAAHCFFDRNTGQRNFTFIQEGKKSGVLVGVDQKVGRVFNFTVTKVEAFPNFWYPSLNAQYPMIDADNPSAASMGDIGIVWIKEDTETLPVVPVSFTPIVTGQDVTVAGFGCTADGTPNTPFKQRFGRGKVVTVKGSMAAWEGHTPEGGLIQSCHGDSGAPIFVNQPDGSLAIGGIGSGHHGNGSVFSRLDDGSPVDTAKWLRQQVPRLASPTGASPAGG